MITGGLGSTALISRSRSSPLPSGIITSQRTTSKLWRASSRRPPSTLRAVSRTYPSWRNKRERKSSRPSSSSTISRRALMGRSDRVGTFERRSGELRGGEEGGLRCHSQVGNRVARQLHGDRGAAPRPAVHVQPAAVLLDDAIDDGHADPRAAVEERAERMEEIGALLLGHAAAGVDHPEEIGILAEPSGDPEGSSLGHGAQGVARQVPEDLAHLVRIAQQAGGGRIEIDLQRVPVRHLVAVFEQLEVLGEQPGDVEGDVGALPRAGETEEALDRPVEALALLEQDLDQP